MDGTALMVDAMLKKLHTPLPRGSSLCEGMGEGCCTQSYPCICKEAVSGFEPMTNRSPRHNFTAAPGLALMVDAMLNSYFSTTGRISVRLKPAVTIGFKPLVIPLRTGPIVIPMTWTNPR